MKRNIIIAVALALVAGLAVTWVALKNRQASSGTTVAGVSPGSGKGSLTRTGAGKLAGNGGDDGTQQAATSTVGRAARRLTALDLVDDPNLSDADKKLIVELQDALDDDDLKGVTAAARQLMKSKSEPARVRTATALGWFGAAALPELIEMLSDPSSDVVEAAMTPTLDAIDNMEDGPEKADMLSALIATINDLESLEDALMLFSGIEDEITIPHLERLIEMFQNDLAKVAALTSYLNFVKGANFF